MKMAGEADRIRFHQPTFRLAKWVGALHQQKFDSISFVFRELEFWRVV